MLELNKIYNMDCLEGMKYIEDKSIDMILCDLPYGTTECSWDTVISFECLWEQYRRIIKDNGVIALFGSEPFSTKLRTSAIDIFKYDWIWIKNKPSGFQHSKNRPLNAYEIISIFSKGSMGHKSLLGEKRMVYNPQGLVYFGKETSGCRNKKGHTVGHRPSHKDKVFQEFTNYPTNILKYDVVTRKERIHNTQKPVELCEYLIKTYTNEGELVLDNCIGSGTTAIACINTNRNYIGFEISKEYCEIAKARIEFAKKEVENSKKEEQVEV
ncbi:MAG: site-specific DNA-methyltransferase [Bacillota bacterium]